MKLVFRQLDDQTKWETFLLTHSPQAFFQSWDWGEVQRRLGNDIRRYGFYTEDNLVGLAQFTVIKAKRGLYFHIRHGPIVSLQYQELWVPILRCLYEMAQKEGVWFVRVSPLIPNTSEHSEMFRSMGCKPSGTHEVDGECCWVLDLNRSKEQLLSVMRKTTRYEIRKAEKMGVQIEKGASRKYIDAFLSLYDATYKRHGFVPHKGIREEVEVLSQKKQCRIYLGSYNNELLSSALIVYHGNQAIYHHGASITSKIPCSYLVQWHAICDSMELEIPLYNFWGIAPLDNPHHPWHGLSEFKKGFGGRELNYMHSQDLVVSSRYYFTWLIDVVNKKIKKY